jgi:hypothetical protein
MPNAAISCCTCKCVAEVPCDKCADPPDYTPDAYSIVVAGVTSVCVAFTPGLDGISSAKASNLNDTYCTGGNAGDCLWFWKERANFYETTETTLHSEGRFYTDGACSSAVALFDGNLSHAGSKTIAVDVELRRIDGGFDLVISQLVVYRNAAGTDSAAITLVVFAGRNASVTNCAQSFTITNGTHPTVTASAGSGGSASITPCLSDCGGACFQAWTATWNCESETWAGPTPGASSCRAENQSLTWVKTASDATTCTYTRYVAYADTHCTSDGVCAGLDDTDPPALPFSGDAPFDCCPCQVDCQSAVICGLCELRNEETPDHIHLYFHATQGNTKCSFENAGNFYVYRVKSNLAWNSYLLTQDPDNPCKYLADITGAVEIWRCVGNGTGCAACDPYAGTNVTTQCKIIFDLDNSTIRFILTVSDTDLAAAGPDNFEVFISIAPEASADCCGGVAYDVTSTEADDWNSVIGSGNMSYQPCDVGAIA